MPRPLLQVLLRVEFIPSHIKETRITVHRRISMLLQTKPKTLRLTYG